MGWSLGALLSLALAGCAGTRPAAETPRAAATPPAAAPAPAAPAGGSRHLAVLSPADSVVALDPDRVLAVGPRRTARGFAWPSPRRQPLAALGPALVTTESGRVVDSVAMWRHRAGVPELREPALLRLAALLAADGDLAGADAALADTLLRRSVWSWEAVRTRERLALARGDTLAADTLLARAWMRGWPDADFAAWTAESARLAALRGDTTRAIRHARDAMRRFPGLPPAVAAMRLLDSLMAARGDSLDFNDSRSAAEVEALRNAPVAGARRLARVLGTARGDDGWRLRLRMAELQRRGRAYADAMGSIGEAWAFATDSATKARLLLERSRIHRDAGRADSAMALAARSAVLMTDPTWREVALWERARELQDLGRFAEAARAFDRVADQRGRRREDAGFLSGLMTYAAGRPADAAARWSGVDHEAARFWRGVVLRSRRDRRGDSLLRVVARTPGYGFYAVAARDTLKLRGMPEALDAARAREASDVARRIAALGAAGLTDEALFLASRWAARDTRVSEASAPMAPAHSLAAASVAALAGRTPRVVGFAQRAQRDAERAPDSLRWAIEPWAFPPAYEAAIAAAADSNGLEPALVLATMRQESVFDPQARSTSNALGLMQLLPPAAQDAAGWGKEPTPAGAAPLLDPLTNLKWGTRYLARLVRRFDGHVPVALSAYNAGASTIPSFWRDLIARGGEALFCEIASNPDAQDYTKKILGFRAAYRELRPHTAP